MHRTCWKSSETLLTKAELEEEDDEVRELLARAQESVPSEEDEKEMSAMQRDTPLSARQHLEELDAYQEMAEEHREEYRRETFGVETFPPGLLGFIDKSAIVDNNVTINRWLNSGVSIQMYRLMKVKWDMLIRKPRIAMVFKVMYNLETDVMYHDETCIPSEEKKNCTVGCVKLSEIEKEDLQEFIDENLNIFFCAGCDRSIVDTFDKWPAKVLGEIATQLVQSKVMHVLLNEEETIYELTTEFDALSIAEPRRKRQKTTHE